MICLSKQLQIDIQIQKIYFWTNAQNQKAFEEQKNLKIIDENSTKTKILKKIPTISGSEIQSRNPEKV